MYVIYLSSLCGEEMKWCFDIKTGPELVKPSDNLSDGYVKKSKDALEMAELSLEAKKKDWVITTIYYSQYLILYALLQKLGIKSENHLCTMLFAKKFLRKKVDTTKIEDLIKLKDERIEKQYFVSDSEMDLKRMEEMNKRAKEFFFYISEIINTITKKEIEEIREKFVKYKKRYVKTKSK